MERGINFRVIINFETLTIVKFPSPKSVCMCVCMCVLFIYAIYICFSRKENILISTV